MVRLKDFKMLGLILNILSIPMQIIPLGSQLLLKDIECITTFVVELLTSIFLLTTTMDNYKTTTSFCQNHSGISKQRQVN